MRPRLSRFLLVAILVGAVLVFAGHPVLGGVLAAGSATASAFCQLRTAIRGVR